jgi:hypothetical protein
MSRLLLSCLPTTDMTDSAQHEAGATYTVGWKTPRATGAGVHSGAGTARPKTEIELDAVGRYEERIEDEYAKRDWRA